MATTVDEQWHFPQGPREYPRDYPITVHTFTTDRVSIDHFPMGEFLKTEFKLANADFKFRWFHLPVNNMAWVELPYMNWDSYGDFCSLRRVYTDQRVTPGSSTQNTATTRVTMQRDLARYLDETLPLHPRRTLDQFYYSSLTNTATRDVDQTISKWTGSNLDEEGRAAAVTDSLMVMVDQLWCWVLDEKTILSFFPSQDLQYHGEGFIDLYVSIRQNCSSCETVWDLYSVLVKEATTYLFRQENRKFTDLIETYSGILSSSLLDDQRELKLVLEVADIIDELKMIQHLVDKQREVLKSLILALRKLNPSRDNQSHQVFSNIKISDNISRDSATQTNGIAGAARDSVISAEEVLVMLLSEIDTVKKDVEYTHKMLLDLLDLKQKTASLAEARSTTQQGRAIMLFTIVTVIFLPLSFFTSYFGQNVSEITGDQRNPTTWNLWRIATPIIVVVIFSALLIAYYITNPEGRLWFWGCGRNRLVRDSPA
ncbi:hypothetical protein DL762_000029 [Monosporascus cannonballus]|uniref:Uncharacterized protein n=1 Tax=Monosporascus cannonballus TaxID=155416 RepID=A0ABY0HLL7_9PEZI|nr:hypothetical protein DL762_000029 [Monosporascus cannonballus]